MSSEARGLKLNMTIRSLLSVPATNPKMIEKALASEADGILIDLEDAVAPEQKVQAREDVVRTVRGSDWRGRRRTFRINALDTPYFYRDLIEIVEAAGDALGCVLVPKIQCAEDLYVVDTLLGQLESGMRLEPGKIRLEGQIESARGLVNVEEIARASSRLEALHYGPGDLAADLQMPQSSIGTTDEWDEAYPGHRFHYAMERIVIAARANRIQAMDGPVADYKDADGLNRSSRISRSLGFDGKWCIHPTQIETVNKQFSPGAHELEWATKIMQTYEKAEAEGSGAITVEGHMVDAASLRMARNLLSKARRYETLTEQR